MNVIFARTSLAYHAILFAYRLPRATRVFF
jgi:hypothetical protein